MGLMAGRRARAKRAADSAKRAEEAKKRAKVAAIAIEEEAKKETPPSEEAPEVAAEVPQDEPAGEDKPKRGRPKKDGAK